MTREEKLYSMTMKALVEEAEKIGVKIDKKGSKQKAVEKMLAAEAKMTDVAEVAETEEEKCGDGTEYAEVMQEIMAGAEKKAEEAKVEKKERKQRKKKEQAADITELLEFIISEWEKIGTVKTPNKENAVFRPLCVESGRQVIKLMWTTKKISFFVRVEEATAYAEKWQKINYAMPFQCMFFHDTEEVRQNIKDIFRLVVDADGVRTKKGKRKGK